MMRLWWCYDYKEKAYYDNDDIYDDNDDNNDNDDIYDDNDDNDDAPVANNVNWDEGVTSDPLICYMWNKIIIVIIILLLIIIIIIIMRES